MAGLRAHRASMVVVKKSRSIMQSFMAARLTFPTSESIAPYHGSPMAQASRPGIISIVSDDNQKAHYAVSAPDVPSRVFVYFSRLCAASNQKTKFKMTPLHTCTHGIANSHANDAGPKGQLTGGGVPYL